MPYKTGIRLLGVARNPANGFPARLLGPVVGFLCDRVIQMRLMVFAGIVIIAGTTFLFS